MIPSRRQNRILEHIAEHDFFTVGHAAELLGVSPATVRRDFHELAERNLADRSRGGITRKRDWADSIAPFSIREVRCVREKSALMRQAAKLLKPGDAVIIDGGTTTFQFGKYIPDFPLRVVTNSLPLATLLGEHRLKNPRLEIVVIGGLLYAPSSVLLGPQAKACLSRYHTQWLFLSAAGLNAQGVSNTDELVTDTERAMISQADKVALVADHTKIGARSMCLLCDLSEIDLLITDDSPASQPFVDHCRERGIEVLLCNTEP